MRKIVFEKNILRLTKRSLNIPCFINMKILNKLVGDMSKLDRGGTQNET